MRFATTHLETGGAAPIQVAQAAELLSILGNPPRPLLLAGDFNSAADGSSTPTYDNILAAGLVDIWDRAHPQEDGFTDAHDKDLLNAESELDRRIDFIFERDGLSAGKGRTPGLIRAIVVGDEQGDRTASGLWPSDHGGIVARLLLPPPTLAGL